MSEQSRPARRAQPMLNTSEAAFEFGELRVKKPRFDKIGHHPRVRVWFQRGQDLHEAAERPARLPAVADDCQELTAGWWQGLQTAVDDGYVGHRARGPL